MGGSRSLHIGSFWKRRFKFWKMEYTNAADNAGIIQDDCDFDGKEGGGGIIGEARCECQKKKWHRISVIHWDINEGEVYSCDCDLVEMRIVKKLENCSISFCFPVYFLEYARTLWVVICRLWSDNPPYCCLSWWWWWSWKCWQRWSKWWFRIW